MSRADYGIDAPPVVRNPALGGMRELPSPDTLADMVVMSLSIHNIPNKEGRTQAIQEIYRVFKPSGQIALLDFVATDEYFASFQALGWRELNRSGSSFWMFLLVGIVSGKKPS